MLILSWGFRYFLRKRGQQEKGALILIQGIEAPLDNYIRCWRNFHKKPVFFCFLFFGDKERTALKTPLLLNSFDLPSCGSEFLIEKRIQRNAVLIYLETGRALEVILTCGEGQMTYLGGLGCRRKLCELVLSKTST